MESSVSNKWGGRRRAATPRAMLFCQNIYMGDAVLLEYIWAMMFWWYRPIPAEQHQPGSGIPGSGDPIHSILKFQLHIRIILCKALFTDVSVIDWNYKLNPNLLTTQFGVNYHRFSAIKLLLLVLPVTVVKIKIYENQIHCSYWLFRFLLF